MQWTALQFDVAWEAPDTNALNVTAMLGAADPQPGSVVALPELFATGFTMNADLAVRAEEKTRRLLSELARALEIHLVAGLARATPTGPANQAVWFDPAGELAGSFTKLHPFSPAGEHHAYVPGQDVAIWDIAGLAVAPLLCYDLRFPESFRRACLQGAEVFCVPANWPAVRQEHFRTLLRARAIENQACVVGINRIGADPNARYAGGSVAFDATGGVLAEAGSGPEALAFTIDPQAIRSARADFPALADRRDDGR